MISLLGIVAAHPAVPAAFPSLAGVYVVCLIVGGGLLVVSTVFGGEHDADVDVDGGVDLDVQADLDVEADLDATGGVEVDHAADAGVEHAAAGHDLLAVSTWFSIRFLVYFAAAFGLVGTVLSYLTGLSSGAVCGLAVGSGLVVGQGVHRGLRVLRRTSGDSTTTSEDYLNKPARVTIAIDPPARGEVALTVRGKEQFVAAAARRPDDRFAVGDRVVITSYSGGTARVVSRDEYEFMNES